MYESSVITLSYTFAQMRCLLRNTNSDDHMLNSVYCINQRLHKETTTQTTGGRMYNTGKLRYANHKYRPQTPRVLCRETKKQKSQLFMLRLG